MATSLTNILSEVYLFASLDKDALEQLAEISSVHSYAKETYLFMQGEESDHLFVLIEGLVSVFKHDAKGNEIIIGLFEPFSLIAEPAILKGIPFPSSATFRRDGKVIKINRDLFIQRFLTDPKVSYGVIQSLLDKIGLLQQNIHLNIAASAKEKISQFYAQNPELAKRLKKYEIASILGMSAETFSRNLKQLAQDKA